MDGEGNRRIIGESLHKNRVEPEYRFEIVKEGKVKVLQEYSLKEECFLPEGDISFPMMLRVRCRSRNDKSEKIFETNIDESTWSE